MSRYATSSGILLYRITTNKSLEFLLVHPGGPYNKYKDLGAWSIPKGEYTEGEAPLHAAKREFEEELGTSLKTSGTIFKLQPVTQKGGKHIQAFACEGNLDCDSISSNSISFEYPYKSGKFIEVPEIDRAEWFSVAEAKGKINPAQIALIEEVENLIDSRTSSET